MQTLKTQIIILLLAYKSYIFFKKGRFFKDKVK